MLHATFKNRINDNQLITTSRAQHWESMPNSGINLTVCDRENPAISWKRSDENKGITSNQLIVQENHVVQFKVVMYTAYSNLYVRGRNNFPFDFHILHTMITAYKC